MVSISDDLHQLAVAVAGGLSPSTFLSRGARAPLAPLVPTPMANNEWFRLAASCM